MKRFNQGIYAKVTSGVIAAIIFLIIALATAWAAGKAVLGALLVGLVTFTVAFLITQTIMRVKRRAQQRNSPSAAACAASPKLSLGLVQPCLSGTTWARDVAARSVGQRMEHVIGRGRHPYSFLAKRRTWPPGAWKYGCIRSSNSNGSS